MEEVMKRLQQLWLGMVVSAGVIGFTAITPCVSAGNVVIHIGIGAPAPQPVVYHYVYYPEEEVYFVPETRVYWWTDGTGWYSGPRVPEGIRLGARVNLDVDAPEPWRHHTVIIERFPGHHHHDRDRDRDRDRDHDRDDHDHDRH
jgi:hypothetical protein